MKSPLLVRHHNAEVCPTAEINSTIPDSTFPDKHLDSFFVLTELPPTPNLHFAMLYQKPMCTNLIKAPSYQLLIWDYHIWFSVHCPSSHVSISKTRQQPPPIPWCAAHRDISCGSSPEEVSCIHEAPWNTQLHPWQRTCQCSQDLPSHSCHTLHVRYNSQHKYHEQGCSFVEVMRHCSYYHELEKHGDPQVSPAIVSLPSSDNTSFNCKMTEDVSTSKHQIFAVLKPSGIKSWKNLVWMY